MDNQLNKLTALVADLLDTSRIEAGKIQFQHTTFSINTLLTEVVEELQRTADKHKLTLKLQKDITITADRERIGQVLINLIANAIKYSPNAKKVEIVISRNVKKEVQIAVKDYGVGISTKDQLLVFDRFFRATHSRKHNYPGLGLGLYISAEIIKRHNGKIWLESKKGKGSIFFFSLPIQ